jgi:hypothetical protein
MIKIKSVSLFFLLVFSFQNTFSQANDCDFKAAVINIDFGTVANVKNIDLAFPVNYSKSKTSCPDDGQYIITNYSPSCFSGKWHALSQDHTANDVDGKMMVVNASLNPSTFFKHNIIGLTASKTYEVSFYMVNICKYADGCSPTPPNIQFTVLNGNTELVKVQTGSIVQTDAPLWRKFYIDFVMPSADAVITIKMEDITVGGCGNDFAIDDIVFKECRKKEAKIIETPKPLIVAKETPKKIQEPIAKEITKPIIEKPKTIPTPVKKIPEPIEKKVEVVKPTQPIVRIEKIVEVPKVIATRENALAKKILTEEAEMILELYDNGDIDGDTVTIFHNNKLVVNHAGLSLKPITIKIKVDKNEPHHELVMVVDNLGSIPPNTSLMIITANKKRYEVYISSSEQKNAKVIIDLIQ